MYKNSLLHLHNGTSSTCSERFDPSANVSVTISFSELDMAQCDQRSIHTGHCLVYDSRLRDGIRVTAIECSPTAADSRS